MILQANFSEANHTIGGKFATSINVVDGYDDGYDDGWDAGYDEGYSTGFEDGKQDEQDRFWDEFQDYGNRTYYSYAFYYRYGWTDKNFKPKYPFTIEYASAMFDNSRLTSIVQPIDISNAKANYTGLFKNSTLVTIPKFITAENKTYTDDFTGCTKLKNITFEGVIGRDLNMQWCPLTVESAISIITHLKDYSGTDKADTYSITLSSDVWNSLNEWAEANTDFFTANEYCNHLGWNTP